MRDARDPDWLDPRAMTSWAEATAAAVGGRVEIHGLDGAVLVAAGRGEGRAERFPLAVNGSVVARVEVRPPVEAPGRYAPESALATLGALAEARNTITDLARTAAQQWRELTLLYRSSQLLSGGLSAPELADRLLEQALRALRSSAGATHLEHPVGCGDAHRGDGSDRLSELLGWAAGLEHGVVVSEPDELLRLGFTGSCPEAGLIAVPVISQQRSYGALVVAAATGRSFGSEHLKLADLLVSRVAQACENLELLQQVRETERLTRELELAAEIQSSILPRPPMGNAWLEIAGSCTPAEVVGGDAFFVVRSPDDAWVLVGVADVCGHGLSSALLSDAYASHVKALAPLVEDPGELLVRANELLVDRLGMTGLFVTSLLIRLQADGGIEVASAGHPPPVLIDPRGDVRTVDGAGPPLGVLQGAEYRCCREQVASGTLLVMYSDGVTESRSPAGEFFDPERLEEIVRAGAASGSSCEGLHREVVAALEVFRGGRGPADDATLVVARRLA